MSTVLLEKRIEISNEIKPEISYVKLNTDNENEVVELEKALYNEFTERNPDSWIPKKYIKINNCRFKIPMNYKNLGIYIAQKNNIIMSFGFNFNNINKWQAEEMGFKNINKDNGTLEGIFFFSVQSELKGLNFFDISNNLFITAKNDFTKNRIIKKVIFTCSKKQLNMYELMECQVIQKIMMDNEEEKYLLCFFI